MRGGAHSSDWVQCLSRYATVTYHHVYICSFTVILCQLEKKLYYILIHAIIWNGFKSYMSEHTSLLGLSHNGSSAKNTKAHLKQPLQNMRAAQANVLNFYGCTHTITFFECSKLCSRDSLKFHYNSREKFHYNSLETSKSCQ